MVQEEKYWEEKPVTRDNTIIIIIIKNTHTIYEQVVTCMFSRNPYLFYHLFWKYNFLFTPILSGTQPGHESRWYLLHS